MTIDGELRALRALARQLRGAQHADVRRLSAWAAQIESCARGLDRGVSFLRQGIAEPPSAPLAAADTSGGSLPAPDADRPGKRRRAARRTSAEAATLVTPRTGTQRARVLEAVAAVARDPRTGGLTDVELARATGLPPNSVRPRRVELVDDGWLEDSGKTREHLGREHTVWRLSARAAEALAGAA